VQVFKSPKESVGDLGAQSAANLIAASNDVAVVVDGKGVIRDVAFNKDELSLELDGRGRWLGSDFLETVTNDSRIKLKAMLQDIADRKSTGWRQVNHPSPAGADIPVLYSAIDIGRKDRTIFVGRDLRQLATMQQRLISAQQTMERDYTRLRQAETRYRLLFQVASEAVLIVDTNSHAIVDANPAALALFDEAAPTLLKTDFVARFEPADAASVSRLLADVRSSGRDGSAQVHVAHGKRQTVLHVSLFRQENASLFLVRLSSPVANGPGNLRATSLLLRYFDQAPDGLVITQYDSRIIRSNAAFAQLVETANEEQARGEPLDRWLGRTGVDFNVAFATLKQNGSVKLFATALRGELGGTTDVEVSAVALADEEGKPNFGFVIRDVEKRLSGGPLPSTRELPRSVAQLTEMIGRVPLRDLVRETTDVIEKLSIEAALELTGDNRASAAEMLGLSRQSLYVKLRRFGLAEHAADDENEDG
jgi:transcriptional regulator PpsR